MATDLAAIDQTAGHRDPVWKALNLLFSPTDVVRAELGDDAPSAIAAALALTEHEMRPVPVTGADRKQWEDAMDERLRRLAAKVLPTAGEGANAWREAMVEALSDLPAMVALTAAKKAIHTPFRFVGEIEVEVRRIAEEAIKRRRVRRARLETMKGELERVSRPTVTLLPPEPAAPPTKEQVDSLNAFMQRSGLSTRFDVDGGTYQAAAAAEGEAA